MPGLAHAAHRDPADAEEGAADGDDRARPPAVGEPARDEREGGVDEGVEGEDAGEAGAAPAELVEHRREEDAEGVLGAIGHEEDDEGAADDHPSIEERPARGPVSGRAQVRALADSGVRMRRAVGLGAGRGALAVGRGSTSRRNFPV